MKVALTLLSILLLRVFLIVLSEGVGKEEEDPGEKKGESDPDLQTIIIHADSSKTLQKNFDDLEDSGWLENWNVPLIIANSENGAKAKEVEKVQKRVKFLPGRFKNKKAVIHMKDENKMTGKAVEESVIDSWIVGDTGAGSTQKKGKSKLKKSVKKTKATGKKQEKDKAFSGPEDMDKDNNMHTIIIHSDTDEAQRRYFDELEDTKAMDNWMVPRVITNAHSKEKRKQINSGFQKKEHIPFQGRFTNKQAVIHIRDNSILFGREKEDKGKEGVLGDEQEFKEMYDVAKMFITAFGTIEYYWIHLKSDEILDFDQAEAARHIPWYLTSKTFVTKPSGTYIYYTAINDEDQEILPVKLNDKSSFHEQWETVENNALKELDLTILQYTKYSQKPVLMGFWDETCENMEWSLKIKLNRAQNLAHVCLLHELRKSRSKFYVPVDGKNQSCAKYPLNCTVDIKEFLNKGFLWHSLITVDGTEDKVPSYKNEKVTPTFFQSAGGYERLVVGYFILKPEETSKFNVFKGFLYAEALVAILAFGVIMTALIFFSGHALPETMFYMFAAVFEQGQRVPINAHEHGRRAFFGKVICFLWLLSWLILRQFLSGALVSNLTREDPPNAPSNQGCLIDFLKKEGAILVEPLKLGENEWFRKSRGSTNKSSKTGQCWKEDFVTHVFDNDMEEDELFPELKLMACIKSAAESTSSSCKKFQNITVPFAFSYISTEKRMETMKKLAKLVDKGIFVSTSNVDTPFVKPNFFAPYIDNFLQPLLSKDFAKYFESGIYQKWEKLDQEMEGLAGCMTHELGQNQTDLTKASEEQQKEAKRRCRKLLASDKKSGKDWIKQQLGSIDAIKFKEVKFPLLILCAGNFFAFLIFLVERFAPRRVIAWILEKHEKLKFFFLPKPTPRVGPMYPQDFELSDRVKLALEVRKRLEMAENLADTEADQEENASANDEDKLDDPMADLRRSATCSSQHLEEHEKERLETLLALIEANDRLVFSDEDLKLLHKSGVIMTDEEAAELAMDVQPDGTPQDEKSQENEVLELQMDSPKKPGNVTEAWVEQEKKPSKPLVESQDARQSPQPGPTRPKFWEDDLGEIFTTKGESSESDGD